MRQSGQNRIGIGRCCEPPVQARNFASSDCTDEGQGSCAAGAALWRTLQGTNVNETDERKPVLHDCASFAASQRPSG